MTFSNTVAQQREKQAKSLKQFVMVCVAGSVALHGGGLFLKINDLWNSDEPLSEEITIVVTEDEPEIAVTPEESVSEAIAPSQVSSPSAATFSEPTVVDAPAPTPPPEPAAEEPPTEAPVMEAEPTPTEEVAPEEIAEDSAEEPEEVSAPAEPTPRNFSNLLAEMRRARQQAGPSMTAVPTQTGENSPAATAGTPSETAAAPTQPGSGTAPESTAPSRQGGRSREITCRGCNFDYPDSADGAEGTAQVIVETDGQGRVVSVMLSRSSGNAALDRAALEQARRRVRLNNARAGESYPIDVDFVQPNSETAERVRERGDRRSITVEDPESDVTETPETPPATAAEPPIETPDRPTEELLPESPTSLERLTPEPLVTPDDEPPAPATLTPAAPEQSAEEPSPPPEPVRPSPSPTPKPPASVAPAPVAPEPPPETPAQPEPSDAAPDPAEP